MNFKQIGLTKLKGISEKRSALFAKLDINNLEDLLLFFPRDYEDWTEITPLHLIQDGAVVTVQAKLLLYRLCSPKVNCHGLGLH